MATSGESSPSVETKEVAIFGDSTSEDHNCPTARPKIRRSAQLLRNGNMETIPPQERKGKSPYTRAVGNTTSGRKTPEPECEQNGTCLRLPTSENYSTTLMSCSKEGESLSGSSSHERSRTRCPMTRLVSVFPRAGSGVREKPQSQARLLKSLRTFLGALSAHSALQALHPNQLPTRQAGSFICLRFHAPSSAQAPR